MYGTRGRALLDEELKSGESSRFRGFLARNQMPVRRRLHLFKPTKIYACKAKTIDKMDKTQNHTKMESYVKYFSSDNLEFRLDFDVFCSGQSRFT